MNKKVTVNTDLKEKNNQIAAENQHVLKENGVFCLNMMSSPGSGKTTLLEKTVEQMGAELAVGVIGGDLATERDAARLKEKGIQVYQVNTGSTCHLNANMVQEALNQLDLTALDLLVIENVGNLICPAAWQLGEDKRALLLSVPEGDDKLGKYPKLTLTCDVLVINKIDLAEACNFNLAQVERDLSALGFTGEVIKTSCVTGRGLDHWMDWLKNAVKRNEPF